MSRLTIERVLETSYLDMGSTNHKEAVKALKGYSRQIKLLGENACRLEPLKEMIDPVECAQPKIEAAVVDALGVTYVHWPAGARRAGMRPDTAPVFRPGCSAVVLRDTGKVCGVYDTPNNDPRLWAYGSGLMWAMLHVGREKFTISQAGSSACIPEGYQLISRALFGNEVYGLPLGEKHHIGSSTRQISMYPHSTSMRRFETLPFHAGVSGVLLTAGGLEHLLKDSKLRIIADEARATNAHDGFDGNIFAGSIDSSLGSYILASMDETAGHLDNFSTYATQAIKERHAHGINVH